MGKMHVYIVEVMGSNLNSSNFSFSQSTKGVLGILDT